MVVLGRENEIELLRAAILEPGIVAVFGPAGVGKSAVVSAALEPSGTVVVHVGPEDTPLQLARRALLGSGLPAFGRAAPERRLASVVADRPNLVWVFESEGRARRALVEIASVIASARGRVVIVSRAVVVTGGERRIPILPFPVPSELRDSAVLALWTALVRKVRPTYHVKDSELPLVSAILRRLDGLPLLVAVVAARMAALDHGSLLRELSEGDAGRELAAIRSVLRSSWKELGETEREVLLLGAVFPGTFDAGMLASVAAPMKRPKLHRAIQTLVESSWLLPDPSRDGGLRVLRIVRELVSKLSPAPFRRAEAKFARAYAELAREWNAAAEQHFDIGSIRANAAELLHAARLSRSAGHLGTADPCIAALSHLVQIGREPSGYAELVKAMVASVREPDSRARLLYARLLLARAAERTHEVTRLAKEILGGAKRGQRSRFVRGATLHTLGSIAIEAGDDAAGDWLEQAREVFRGWSGEEALVLAHLALLEQRARRVPIAIARLREAQAIARHFHHPRALAIVASMLGAVLAEHGDPEAERVLAEAIAIANETGDLRTEAYAETCRGASLLARFDPSAAAGALDRATLLFRDVGAPSYEAFARQELGVALALAGERPRARRELEAAIDTLRRAGYDAANLGEAHLALLDWEDGLASVAIARLNTLEPTPQFARLVKMVRAFLEDDPIDGEPETADERTLRRRIDALLRRAGRVDTQIALDGSRFRSGAREVLLETKPALKRVLGALAGAFGTKLSPSEVVAAAWPGERALRTAALNRLYVSIRRLRELGLDGVIETDEGGYRLAPSVQIVARLPK